MAFNFSNSSSSSFLKATFPTKVKGSSCRNSNSFGHSHLSKFSRHKSLREALNSPLLKAMRKRQPYSKNLLMPCIIIDNPHLLREIVKETNARPTHDGAETLVEDKKITEHLDNYSKRMHNLTDKVWNERYANKGANKGNVF